MAVKLSYSIRAIVLLLIMSEHTMSFMMPTILIYYLESMLGFQANTELGLREISIKIGILEGTYGICALVGGIIWGFISDKIGRKRTLQIILIGIGISSIGFGFSPFFEVALFWRITAGLFAGIIPMTKTLIRDLSTDENISTLYSYFGAGYGASSIFGPLIGSFLSFPNNSLKINILDSYPYVLSFITQYFLNSSFLVFMTLALITIYIPNRDCSNKEKPVRSYKSLVSRNYLLSVLVLFLSIYIQYTYRTLISLWLRLTEDKGGMGWSTPQQVGLMNGCSGIISMLVPLYFTDAIKAKFEIRGSCIVLSCVLIVPISLITHLTHIEYIYIQYFLLVIFNGISIALFTIYLSVISISISNSVDKVIAGTAIGISQAGTSFGRASAISGTAFIFGYHQVPAHLFYLSDLLFLITIGVILGLDRRVETRDKIECCLVDEKEEHLLERKESIK